MSGAPERAAPVVPTMSFLGMDFALLDLDAALVEVERRARLDVFSYVVTPNVDHLVRIDRERREGRDISAAWRDADLCLCDSRILAKLARLSGKELRLVAGSDLTLALFGRALRTGDRVALIGGDGSQVRWIAERWPGVELLRHEPPMGVLRDVAAQEAIVRFIEESPADYTLFAIGAPQSELLCRTIRSRGRARGVALCVGASIEFLTGTKRRAPRWMRSLSLEWLFRLASEPRRLGRRYLVEGPRIFAIWWRARRT